MGSADLEALEDNCGVCLFLYVKKISDPPLPAQITKVVCQSGMGAYYLEESTSDYEASSNLLPFIVSMCFFKCFCTEHLWYSVLITSPAVSWSFFLKAGCRFSSHCVHVMMQPNE